MGFVVVQRQTQLLQMVLACHPIGRLLDFLDRGTQKAHDGGGHHLEFIQSKT